MAVTEREYWLLSKLAYTNFSEHKKVYDKGILIPLVEIEEVATTLSHDDIVFLGNWQLVNYVNRNGSSGYCGAVFYNSETNDTVLASSGTQVNILKYGMGDLKQDVQLALGGGVGGPNNQFADAEAFLIDTLSRMSGQSVSRYNLARFVEMYHVSLTGQSLGGALSEFLTYRTGGRAVTFNGVGIGQVLNLDRDAASVYNVLHIVIDADLIGNFGIALGIVRSLRYSVEGDYIDSAAISRLAGLINRYVAGEFSAIELSLSFTEVLVQMDDSTRNYVLDCISLKTHGLELFPSHLDPFDNSFTKGIVTNDGYGKEIADALLNLSSSWSPAISKFIDYLQRGLKAMEGRTGSVPNSSQDSGYADAGMNFNLATFAQKLAYNIQVVAGTANPALVDATLYEKDIKNGYRIEINPNGVPWRVNAAGIPHQVDLDSYFEQERVIELATQLTLGDEDIYA
jgi:hypothetical protein